MNAPDDGTRAYLKTMEEILRTRRIPENVSLPIVVAGQILMLDRAESAERKATEAKDEVAKQGREVLVHRIALGALGTLVLAAYGFHVWDWPKLLGLFAHR